MNSKLSSKLQDAHDNYFNFNYDENILRHVIEVEAGNVDEEVCDVIKENANLPSVWNFFTSEEPITLFLKRQAERYFNFNNRYTDFDRSLNIAEVL